MSLLDFISQRIRTLAWPSQSFVLPKIQNHRGYHLGGARENSLEAFAAARINGGKCCELDVGLSKDQIPVVFHDKNLQRLFGIPSQISEFSAQDLFQKWQIPSLEMLLIRDDVTEFFNIEIKSTRINDALPRKVAEVIRKSSSQSRIMISSFNPASLYLIQNFCPEVPRALLASSDMSSENKWYLRNLLGALVLDIHMLNLDQKMLSPSILQILKDQNISFSAWTVNDLNQVRYFLAAGAKSIITDLKITDQDL